MLNKETSCLGLFCKHKYQCDYYKRFGTVPYSILPVENCNKFMDGMDTVNDLFQIFKGK